MRNQRKRFTQLPSPAVTVVQGAPNKSGAFAVVAGAGTEAAVEQCRHRTLGQAEKCSRSQCSHRYSFLYRAAQVKS